MDEEKTQVDDKKKQNIDYMFGCGRKCTVAASSGSWAD